MWLFIEKILRLISGFFIVIWVARYLGIESFGLLNYAMSMAGIFTVFATLGLDLIVVRELVNSKVDRDIILGTSLVIKAIATIISLVILLFALYIKNDDYLTSVMIFVIGTSSIFQIFNVIDFY